MYRGGTPMAQAGRQEPGLSRVAVGRIVFWDPLVQWRSKSFISDATALAKSAGCSRRFADILYEAKEETR
jgi:hypothetical protein